MSLSSALNKPSLVCPSYLCSNGVCLLVGELLMLLRDFGHYDIFMNVRVIITVVMVWLLYAVKEFWVLLDNIVTVVMVMLLRETYYVCITAQYSYNLDIQEKIYYLIMQS